VIRWGTTRAQETVTGTLADIVEKSASLKAPALIVVGQVVELRDRLSWFATDAESLKETRSPGKETFVSL
jgi:siroheme synthase